MNTRIVAKLATSVVVRASCAEIVLADKIVKIPAAAKTPDTPIIPVISSALIDGVVDDLARIANTAVGNAADNARNHFPISILRACSHSYTL